MYTHIHNIRKLLDNGRVGGPWVRAGGIRVRVPDFAINNTSTCTTPGHLNFQRIGFYKPDLTYISGFAKCPKVPDFAISMAVPVGPYELQIML